MSEYSTPQPAHPGGTPHVPPIDLVAGDPPVPITVWRTARSGDDQSTTVSHRLAYRLVAAYSRPGESVIDLTDTHVLDTACLRGGRRHHPAWFTSASALFVGPRTPQYTGEPHDSPDSDGPDDSRAWFGDDLTDPDPDRVSGDEPPDVPGNGDDLQGRTSLVVATWPLDASSDAANRVRLAWLLAACRRLLRPGGCLVLVVGVAADTDGDRFTYHATDEELLSLARTTSAEQFMLHVRVHADLLVFTSRQGGDRRA